MKEVLRQMLINARSKSVNLTVFTQDTKEMDRNKSLNP